MSHVRQSWTATFTLALALSLLTWSIAAGTLASGPSVADSGHPPARLLITVDEALGLHRTGEVLFVDVRSSDRFSDGHVAHAVHVTPGTIEARTDDLRARAGGRLVVVYCACPSEASSLHAAQSLSQRGVGARALAGGYGAWAAAGGPIVTGPDR